MNSFVFSLLPLLLTTAALAYPASSNSSIASPRLPLDFYRRQCDCYVVSGSETVSFENYAFWDFRKIPLPRYGSNGSKDRANRRRYILSRVDGIDNDEGDNEEHNFGMEENVDNEESVDNEGNVDDEESVDDEENTDDGMKAVGKELDFGTLLFSQTAFARDWKPQKWHRKSNKYGPVPIINSQENIFFASNTLYTNDSESTHLVLRTTRFPNHTATAELEHHLRNIFHCSLRVRMRVMTVSSVNREPMLYGRPVPKGNTTKLMAAGGACAGIFTYRSSTCESDIEILTSDPPNIVRYANQPDYDPITDAMIPGAASVGTLSQPWTNPTTHRVDWLHNITKWYADGEIKASNTYHVPDQPSMMAINLWSNGGEWTGDMPVGQSVYIGIEWIEVAYNTSTKVNGAPSDTVPFPSHKHRPFARSAAVGPGADHESLAEEVEFIQGKEGARQCLRPCFLDDVRGQ
ncbi:beta-glucanase [Aspergillus udagawae]|nr:beta-glucanase [Aspergillus udagawae]GFG20264.1 beta-glucanase [Aspergillus udagawae]